MKNLILLLLYLICYNGYSQEKHEDGLYKEFYKNGELKREGFYKNNEKVGVWKNSYKNGKHSKVYSYSNNGKLTGINKTYSKEGILTSETNRNQKGDLECKLYSESKKVFAQYSLVSFKNGTRFLKQGLYEEYYDSGNLKVKCNYFKNEINGIWEKHYETGEKEWEVEYKDGYRHETYKQFYKNGILKVKGSNFEDYKNGNEKQFDEKDNIIWDGVYRDGKLHGTWQQYNEDGNVINKLKYKVGELKKGDNSITINKIEVPDGLIYRTPVYPGCNLPGNYKKRTCMSKEISGFVKQKFNTNFVFVEGGHRLTGEHRINVIFKIDKTGNVTDIRAKAKYKAIEAEAVRGNSIVAKNDTGF